MAEKVDTVVIGAGVIGLAVARSLALRGREVIVLEQHDAIGTETSSRNSEVIHAGIYYRPGGLRARLCVRGKALLYAFCEQYGVDCLRTEKLIVAADAGEAGGLAAIQANASANGVNDLQPLGGDAAARLEPGLRCHAALLSPSTGIVDSHGLMVALDGAIEESGGMVVLESPVLGGAPSDVGLSLRVGGASPMELNANIVVNAAGLHAERVARAISGIRPDTIPAIRYAKGQYFTVSGRAPFSRLVYPMPARDTQGVHYTRDLGGQARLGPDISWGAALGDYDVDVTKRREFWRAARRFWPDLEESRLQPGYAGLRPKIAGPGEEGDFRIVGPNESGVPGLVGLFGIESPGLTSCLAVGEFVGDLVAGEM